MLRANRIVISRKGFDSTAGGVASPIIDGRLVSLPIPEEDPVVCDDDHIAYEDLGHQDNLPTIASIVRSLTKGKEKEWSDEHKVHLDPDLRSSLRSKKASSEANKTYLFGQSGGAQAELDAVKSDGIRVDAGDLFLFFGWFKDAQVDKDGICRYKRGAKDKHVLWGWLEVGRRWDLMDKQTLALLQSTPKYNHHPHVSHPGRRTTNILYESTTALSFHPDLPGAGLFDNYTSELCLTSLGGTRAKWELPGFFRDVKVARFKFKNWESVDSGQSIVPPERCKGCGAASQGQEFIFDPKAIHADKIEQWVLSKFDHLRKSTVLSSPQQ